MRFAILAVALCCATTTAQQDSKQADETAALQLSTEVLALKFASAPETVDVLTRLGMQLRIAADPRTNSLVLTGPKNELIRASKLILNLDQQQPVRQARTKYETAIIPLRHRDVRSIATSAELVLAHRGSMALDHARNTLVLRSTAAGVQAVRSLVTAVDVPQRSLFGSFFLLGPSDKPLPEASQYTKIRGQLQRLGLNNYGIIARTAVRTIDGAKFSAIASIKGEGSVSIKGETAGPTGQADVQMTLEVIRGNDVIGTTVKAPLGDLVIIGFTPSAGEPVVLAMRFE